MEHQAKFEKPWYEDGLRFSCTRCGNCCRGPGYVWVDDAEVELLACHFELSYDQFCKMYTRKIGKNRSLRDQANEDCIFFDQEAGCLVYDVRPIQCRTWPFWPHNLESPEDWGTTQKRCPGSGQGELFTLEQITSRLQQMKKSK